MVTFDKTIMTGLGRIIGGRYVSNCNKTPNEWTEGKFFVQIVSSPRSRSTIIREATEYLNKYQDDETSGQWQGRHRIDNNIQVIDLWTENEDGESQALFINIFKDSKDRYFATIDLEYT